MQGSKRWVLWSEILCSEWVVWQQTEAACQAGCWRGEETLLLMKDADQEKMLIKRRWWSRGEEKKCCWRADETADAAKLMMLMLLNSFQADTNSDEGCWCSWYKSWCWWLVGWRGGENRNNHFYQFQSFSRWGLRTRWERGFSPSVGDQTMRALLVKELLFVEASILNHFIRNVLTFHFISTMLTSHFISTVLTFHFISTILTFHFISTMLTFHQSWKCLLDLALTALGWVRFQRASLRTTVAWRSAPKSSFNPS